MKRLLLTLVLFSAMTVQGTAQTAPYCEVNCAVRVGQSFIAFTEADQSASQYWLTVDGVRSSAVGTIVDGWIEFTHPGFTSVGTRTLAIHMQTSLGEVATDPLPLSVVRRKVKIRF